MESESEMGPTRFRAYMIFAVVIMIFAVVMSLVSIGVGIWGIGWSNEPFLGWFMLAVGIATTTLSILQLRRA